MVLTEFGMSPAALSQAKSLAVRGLMTYQPFVFDETLECGVGYEFERDAHVGLVHYPDLAPELLQSPELDQIILGPGHLDEFRAANAQLSKLYDHFADQPC